MSIRLRAGGAEALDVSVAVCFAFEGDAAPLGVEDAGLRRLLAAEMKARRVTGRRGDLLDVSAPANGRSMRFLVVGLGDRHVPLAEVIGEASSRAVRAAEKLGARKVGIAIPRTPADRLPEVIRAASEGTLLGAYRFDRYLNDPSRKGDALDGFEIAATAPSAKARRAIEQGVLTARAVRLARDLVNEPPAVLTPKEMARRSAAEAKRRGLGVRVLDETALRRLGMRTVLAVGKGSGEPPRVVHLVYRPKGKRPSERVALVGKGVTFDSGGLNLKPGASMLTMKGDMSGAAAVLAAMSTLAESGCRAEVHGLLGLVENMPGGRALKPGDIVRTWSGKTVEVQDTDAEGRLVLCDLLAYAAATVKPARMVDVATLTGAIVVALGKRVSGAFSRDGRFLQEILESARDAGEKFWALPMEEDYLEHLQDGPADLRNIGERGGGAISAALFLGEFVPRSIPWVHLDIAGTAFLERARPETPAGGTGVAVRTLVRWLEGL
jgi:leucyl aminopeptidase